MYTKYSFEKNYLEKYIYKNIIRKEMKTFDW